jgi:polar amino acid transport system substrate-binding protein
VNGRRLLLALLAALASALGARAQQPLRWGADLNGGGPYVYENERGELTGFEWDLAQWLAAGLDRRAEHVYGQWDKLPQLLERGDIDVVLNGYEWSAEREAQWPSSIPYYVYRQQLIARADAASIRDWSDLDARWGAPRRRVGVLGGSAAERYAIERWGDSIELLAYDGVTNTLELVRQRQLDATVQDTPIATHYLPQFPELRALGAPQAPGWYVIYTRRADAELRARIDARIAQGLRDGTLRSIYARYGLWNDEQGELARYEHAWPPASESSTPKVDDGPRFWALPFWPLLGRAALVTIALACLSMPIAILLGIAVAVGRAYGPRWLAWPLSGYVEILRGTPLLLQLYVIYYLLPAVGLRIPEFWAGVFGLSINYSAYEAENYRAGRAAVPRGQFEAALALGMGKFRALRRVVLPQAVCIVIPPVTNDFVALFKDTSVCSVIAVVELTGMYNRLYNNHPGRVLELGLATAVLYFGMSYPVSLLARRYERRLEGQPR